MIGYYSVNYSKYDKDNQSQFQMQIDYLLNNI